MSKSRSWITPLKQLSRRGHAASEHLTALQAWQLKHLARNTGATPGAKKSSTAHDILSCLDATDSQGTYKSVDMGVKNLAVCVVQSSQLNRSKTTSAYFQLLHWERSDILTGSTTTAEPDDSLDLAGEQPEHIPNAYSPSNLAPHAARMAYRLATSHNPSHILIERQRFRSMGGAAVQEWTLRVNSLEAMLYASLETMKQDRDRKDIRIDQGSSACPEVVEMSPARIAAFWNGRGNNWNLDEEGIEILIPDKSSNPAKQVSQLEEALKRGMEKSEKISLVRNWLHTGALDVQHSLQPLATAFMQTGRARKSDGDLIISKKDDLADCVVQGITYALWQRNRRTLHNYLCGLPAVQKAA